MRAAVISSLVAVACAAQAQVSLDGVANHANVNRAVYPLTVGSGSNRALAVFVHVGSNCGSQTVSVTSVTYAGVSLVKLLSRVRAGCTAVTSELWALPPGTQPASGTNDVEVRITATQGTHPYLHSGAISATGVDQVTTFTTTGANDGLSGSAALTLGASGATDLVIDSLCTGLQILSTPQTSRWIENDSGNYACDNAGGATAAGGTTALSWTVTSDHWVLLGAAFKAAAAQTATLDAVAHSEGGTTVAYPLTVDAGTNRALAVFAHVAGDCSRSVPQVSTVTYAGMPLTRVFNLLPASCTNASSTLWTMPAGTEPPTGTNEVLVSLTGPMQYGESIHSGAISAFGVDQTTTFSTMGASDGNRTPVALTLPASGPQDMVVDSFANCTSVIGTPVQTQRWIANVNNYLSGCDNSGGATAPGGTTTLIWDGGNDNWMLVGAAFKAATDGGSVDAGSVDAGSVDAGPDGGSSPDPDAGAGPLVVEVRCGCSSAGGLLALGALLAAAVRQRPRRRPPHPI